MLCKEEGSRGQHGPPWEGEIDFVSGLGAEGRTVGGIRWGGQGMSEWTERAGIEGLWGIMWKPSMGKIIL